jgi:DeoR family transcriptional regulator of aga operon
MKEIESIRKNNPGMEAIKDLFPEERRSQIVQHAVREGRVSVTDLSQLFGVSEVTIRADLQDLSEQGLLLRTHGGAVPASRARELSFTLRRQYQVAQKDLIGAAAAALVSNGDAIFLDTSSTALALARHLHHCRDLTIITNSLPVAESMLEVSGVSVVVPGGTLQRETISLVGTDGLEMLRPLNIRCGFFGAHGLSDPEGLTDVSSAEAEVKRRVVSMCREVVGIIDATKWGRTGLVSFARLSEINAIVTDKLAPAELVQHIQGLGIKIIQV